MASTKVFLLLNLAFAVVLLTSSEVSTRDLVETTQNQEAVETDSVEKARHDVGPPVHHGPPHHPPPHPHGPPHHPPPHPHGPPHHPPHGPPYHPPPHPHGPPHHPPPHPHGAPGHGGLPRHGGAGETETNPN